VVEAHAGGNERVRHKFKQKKKTNYGLSGKVAKTGRRKGASRLIDPPICKSDPETAAKLRVAKTIRQKLHDAEE